MGRTVPVRIRIIAAAGAVAALLFLQGCAVTTSNCQPTYGGPCQTACYPGCCEGMICRSRQCIKIGG